MASVSGGLGDILSLALKKTGVPPAQSSSARPFEPSSVLNEAAGAINDSLLSSDLNTLTQGLFSDLASAKAPSSSSQNSTNTESNFSKSVVPSVQASPPRNGTVQIHTPTSSVARPLSMPVLVKLPSSTPEQSTSYPRNSIQPTQPGPVSTPSASTPTISVSGGFSGVGGGTQPIASSSSSFGSPQGEAPSLTANNSNQAIKAERADVVDQYDYTSVLHGDNIDLASLDEFLATDPMDVPPPPPPPAPSGPVYQNHQFPPAYSSSPAHQLQQQQQHAPVAINDDNGQRGLLYSQSGVPNHQGPALINSGPTNTNSITVSPYANAVPHAQQQQQYHHHQQQQSHHLHQPQANMTTAQYAAAGVQHQQPAVMAAQSYQGQGAILSSPPQPHTQQQQQQMVIVTCAPSINSIGAGGGGDHFQPMSTVSNMPMATDLSNILPPESSIFPSLGTNGSSSGSSFEMPSLSGEDISSILDLDMDGGDLPFDLDQFNFDSGNSSGGNVMTSDPFSSLGMTPSTDLIQPSNTVRLNGSSLVNSSMGSAVNAPQMSYGSTSRPFGSATYTTALQRHQQLQQQQAMKKLGMQGTMFGRGSPTPSRMSNPRARNVGMGRDAIPMPSEPMEKDADDEDDDEDDQVGAADTYANYKPAKLMLGKDHPDPVVESSSLSSVEPPKVWFDLKLPAPVIDEVRLSSLQLEAVVYACQQHKNILADGSRGGYLVGDGAGVGKGRTIAGIIYQNYLEGRKKALWLSVSNDLKFDALRDLRDLGATNIKVYSLNKFRYGKISGKRNGRVRKGVIFATYSSLIGESSSGGKYRTRLNQLLHWLGSHFEGVIVFDECHKAKNLVPSGSGKPSKTGLTVLQLQKKLPKARIVYCSATGASEPKNMAYMSRLGIWGTGTQFPTFQDFIKAVERRGVGAMELVAMDMKLRGMYTARQLSFQGVSFSISEVELPDKFIEAYDASVELWNESHRLFKEASELMGFDKQQLKTMWGQFWASHQRFFKYMCIAAKVPEVIKLAKKALLDGKCVVIGLQSTGEARTLEQLERNSGELTGFISTAKGVLETLIRRHFPAPVSALASIDWSLLDNDPTLPRSCRKRKRAVRRPRMTTFQDDTMMSDSDDSSSPGGSDSAVESSSDDENDKGETSDDSDSDSSSGGKSSSLDSDKEDFNPFGSSAAEPWLQPKKKSKKRKLSPSATPPKKKKKKRNYSIKPPPTSSKRGKTKTGFNSKSLQFEPVQSPSDYLNKKPQPPVLDRRQSIAVVEGITNHRVIPSPTGTGSGPTSSRPTPTPTPPPPGPPHSHLLERKYSLQVTGVGEGQSLVDAMSTRSSPGLSDMAMSQDALVRSMKDDLLRKLDVLAPHLPTNTLDELVEGLGGPDKVAEMTGRRGRVVSLPNGSVQYQLRSEADVPMEMLNIEEKNRFMDGEKDVAIISEAASSGISLQADKRVQNKKRRVHITLELPWSADRAIQQFGRTHRSNQVSAPEYIFLISALSGEQRFASIVAKRLESLGALTHGDRRATESRDLSKYNLDTKFGHQALEITLKSIAGLAQPWVKSEEYTEEFFKKCQTALIGAGLVSPQGTSHNLTVEKDALNMSRFLNRILGLPVKLQNQLFSYFTDTLAAVCQQAKKLGKWDGGIQDFGAQGDRVEVIETKEYVGDPAFCTATTQLVKVKVERGISFKEALQKMNTDYLPGDGFCISNKIYSDDKHTAILIKALDSSGKNYQVYRPNTGRQPKPEKLSALLKRYTKVKVEEAEGWWTKQYDSSMATCQHAFLQGKCRNSTSCVVGLRHRTYHILSGSVLGVWTHIEGVFARHSTHNPRMQIVRVRTPEKRLCGIQIPGSFVEDMTQTLARIDQQAGGTGTSDDPIQL